MDVEELRHRFSRNGIFPVNETALSPDRIFTASMALKESYDRRSPSPEPMPLGAAGPQQEQEEQDESMFSGK